MFFCKEDNTVSKCTPRILLIPSELWWNVEKLCTAWGSLNQNAQDHRGFQFQMFSNLGYLHTHSKTPWDQVFTHSLFCFVCVLFLTASYMFVRYTPSLKELSMVFLVHLHFDCNSLHKVRCEIFYLPTLCGHSESSGSWSIWGFRFFSQEGSSCWCHMRVFPEAASQSRMGSCWLLASAYSKAVLGYHRTLSSYPFQSLGLLHWPLILGARVLFHLPTAEKECCV